MNVYLSQPFPICHYVHLSFLFFLRSQYYKVKRKIVFKYERVGQFWILWLFQCCTQKCFHLVAVKAKIRERFKIRDFQWLSIISNIIWQKIIKRWKWYQIKPFHSSYVSHFFIQNYIKIIYNGVFGSQNLNIE